jgi:hypothetical protein
LEEYRVTIIAYKDGWCWADDLIFVGRMIVGREAKIVRAKNGTIAGAAGDASACSLFLKWAEKGRRGKAPEVFTGEDKVEGAIVIERDGTICDYSGPEPSRIKADHYAVGGAADIAIGAMMAGASAMEGVAIACKSFGWPAFLVGVNHDGEWAELDLRTVSEAAHHDRITRAPAPLDGRRT